MNTIGHQIAKARAAAGISQSELARALQVKPQAVQKWEAGGGPRHARLTEIAQALGVTVSYLVADDGADQGPSSPGLPCVEVSLLANAASMGIGADDHNDDVLAGSICLTDQFVREHVRPKRTDGLRFLHAYGDSTAPTLEAGDVLLVDSQSKNIDIDGIYVLRAHGRPFVKRVRQRLNGQFEISSDNPAHKTVEALNGEHEVEVVGRVLWYWNGHRA